MKNKRVSPRSEECGAVTVEAAIGAVVFLMFCGFIFDFSMMAHRHSLLVDTTIRTVQQLTRDPEASAQPEQINQIAQDLFSQQSARLSAGGMRLTSSEISNCQFQEVTISSEWEAPCAMCFLGRFRRTLKAQGVGKFEIPLSSLECQNTI
jgi:Flp pilus assembly protein TadG